MAYNDCVEEVLEEHYPERIAIYSRKAAINRSMVLVLE